MRAIIIGSGISGLTAAACLAKKGHEVVVLEQSDMIGGVTATIESNGFKWDLGPLLLEKFGKDEAAYKILEELDAVKDIETVRGDRGIHFPDFTLYSPNNYEGKTWRKDKLKSLFPREKTGIDNYYNFYERMMTIINLSRELSEGTKKRIIKKLRQFINFLFIKKFQDSSAEELMEHFFSEEKLKAVFTGILADFCVKPNEFQGLGIPICNVENAFEQRINDHSKKQYPDYRYIKGGTGKVCDALAKSITDCGGKILLNSAVTKIIVENNSVKGVALKDSQRLDANIVIASGGMKETFYDLIGKEYISKNLIQKIDGLVPMESVLMVHLGLDINPLQYQKTALCYYYEVYDIGKSVDRLRKGVFESGKDGFLIYLPSAHSADMAPAGYHAVTIYTVAPNVLNEASWEENRNLFADKLIAYAGKFIPNIADHIVERIVMTPLDFQKLTNLKHHGFGGISPIMGKTNPPHKTEIENLYFVGAQSQSGGGVAGAMIGAKKTAEYILSSIND